MTLNPLKLLENAIVEHGSAVVIKQRLALAQDQFAAISQKLVDATLRAEAAELRCSQLESDNSDLRVDNQKLSKQVRELQAAINPSPHNDLHENCEAILACLAKRDCATVDEISQATGIGRQTVKLHVAEIEKAQLIESSQAYMSTLWRLSDVGRKRMFDRGLLE
jgi:predicted transcriptional regulator